MFGRGKARRAERDVEKAARELQRLGSSPGHDLDSQVADMLAKQHPDGVPAEEAPEQVDAMTRALLAFSAFALPPSEQEKLRAATTSRVMQRADLREGRYYFR